MSAASRLWWPGKGKALLWRFDVPARAREGPKSTTLSYCADGARWRSTVRRPGFGLGEGKGPAFGPRAHVNAEHRLRLGHDTAPTERRCLDAAVEPAKVS